MDMDKTQKIKNPIKMKSIPLICSWCKKVFEIRTWEVREDQKTGPSHGMCPECMKKHEALFTGEDETDKKDQQ